MNKTTTFTIANLTKFWLKMWPLTVVLTALGFFVGLCMASSVHQSYSGNLSLLIINPPETAAAEDFRGIVNSQLFSNQIIAKNSGINDSCSVSGAGTGNIVNISIECTDTESVNLAINNLPSTLRDTLTDIYPESDIDLVELSSSEASSLVSNNRYFSKILILTLSGFILSIIIACIAFDRKVSSRKNATK